LGKPSTGCCFGFKASLDAWEGREGERGREQLTPATIELLFLYSSGCGLFAISTALARLARRLQFIHPSICSIVCLMTGLYPLPKEVLHRG